MRRKIGLIFVSAAAAAIALWIFTAGRSMSAAEQNAFVSRYCADCHNRTDLAGGLDLGDVDARDLAADGAVWENVIRRLKIGMMPPADAVGPPPGLRAEIVSSLENGLDRLGAEQPHPGPALVRRLNRAEYAAAVRDLLALEIDSTSFLPPDDAAYGFDNNAESLGTSPLLVDQYLSAAGRIAALAVGDRETGPAAQIFRFRQDASQDIPAPGMPVGTIGGGIVDVVLPLDGEYRLDVRYYKSNLGAMKGLELAHEIEIAVDGERIHHATIGGREDFDALMRNITEGADAVEARSSTSAVIAAGAHRVSVGFVYRGAAQTSVRLKPFDRSSQDTLDVTGQPHIETLTITGPYDATGPGDTESRRRVFICRPETTGGAAASADELACAERILGRLARRAYRGNETPADVDTLMRFFADGRARRDFEHGIQVAIERLLASPKFTFRIERDAPDLPVGSVHAVTGLELATRLSFFLWSSIPDEPLLAAAAAGDLADGNELERQVRRMLADPRARALTDNFAGQWLYLRNLDSMIPNSTGFPNFDDNLRQAMRAETEQFFRHIVADNRPVTELMTADYTFLNERVARHYGIDGVYGSHFRRVTLDDPVRFGLLGKGSILMISSHTDRTSPVVRGKWVLENLLGTPPPPPLPEVPALEDAAVGEGASLRERLVAHRADPVCSACHALMDPIGFSLENFDAIGGWREREYGNGSPRIDARGRLLDGSEVDGPVELREALMAQPEIFVSTVVEKLMIYALGRGLVGGDMPAIRQIVRDADDADYRFGELVVGIAQSVPFRMRVKPGPCPQPLPRAPEARGSTAGPCRAKIGRMRILRGKSISRRRLLRGLGAGIAMPMLDAMLPAGRALAQSASAPPRRFGVVFVPHGERPGYWTPEKVGRDFELSTILEPLAPYRDELTVVSQLANPVAGHGVSVASWLSGSIPKRTTAEDVRAGVTIDQLIARQVGGDTVFRSLEVATEDYSGYIGGCDPAYSCTYSNTLSWASATEALPMEINPRALFERLFGRPGTVEQRIERLARGRSVLDSVGDDLTDLLRDVGPADRNRLTSYLDNVRETERQIERAERQAAVDLDIPDAPVGIPTSFAEHVGLQFDLLKLAWTADLTRVFTFMLSRDITQRTYPEIGISEPHHAMSHHQGNEEMIANLIRLNVYHMTLFEKFIAGLEATPDGDGSLLDHAMILFGSGMSESNNHEPTDLPTLLVGGFNRRGSRHIETAPETPVANFMLALGQHFGVEIDEFGISTGSVDLVNG